MGNKQSRTKKSGAKKTQTSQKANAAGSSSKPAPKHEPDVKSTPPPAPASASAETKKKDNEQGRKEKLSKDKNEEGGDLNHWEIFNELENQEEADVMNLSSFLDALKTYMPEEEIDGEKKVKSLEQMLEENKYSPADVNVSSMVKVVELPKELSDCKMQDAFNLLDMYKKGDHLMDKASVMRILEAAAALNKKMPTVKYVKIDSSEHMTVIGDLHGQLDDLLLIFRENGLPSEKNPYIFNGDLVDRGPRALEICLVALLFQILLPDHVHINRGNHEDESITNAFGFHREVLHKYDREVYHAFLEVFKWLPLATVLDKRILVLHGGVPRDSSIGLKEINDLPREKYDLGDHPVTDADSKKLNEQMLVMRDILWSDPRRQKGWKESSRGAGTMFGPDITRKFLMSNRLQLVVRSHECVPRGFNWPYGEKGMLVTLFSASNYCGKANNLGAFLRIPADKSKNPGFYQYMASSGERDVVNYNLSSMFKLVVSHKMQLLGEFQKSENEILEQHCGKNKCSPTSEDGETDQNSPDEGTKKMLLCGHKGRISPALWAGCMEDVLKLQLHWLKIRPLLTPVDEDGLIDYKQFLDRYNADGRLKDEKSNEDEEHVDGESSDKLTPTQLRRREALNSLYPHRMKIEALFRMFDKNGDGMINEEEFVEGIKILNKHLPDDMPKFSNPEELMKSIDFSNDKEISVNEFMESFRISAHLTVAAKWRRARTKIRALAALRKFQGAGRVRIASGEPGVDEQLDDEGHDMEEDANLSDAIEDKSTPNAD